MKVSDMAHRKTNLRSDVESCEMLEIHQKFWPTEAPAWPTLLGFKTTESSTVDLLMVKGVTTAIHLLPATVKPCFAIVGMI